MMLRGHIKSVKSSEDAMGDIIHLLTLEIPENDSSKEGIKSLQDLMKKPLKISLEIE